MAQLAIRGGRPVRTRRYPDWPIWDQREIDAVTNVVRSGRWGGFPEPGPHAAAFAAAFAAFQSAKHGICIYASQLACMRCHKRKKRSMPPAIPVPSSCSTADYLGS